MRMRKSTKRGSCDFTQSCRKEPSESGIPLAGSFKALMIAALLIVLLPLISASTVDYSGGGYTGVLPNCTAGYIDISTNTHWYNFRANFSCDIVNRRCLHWNNVSIMFLNSNTSDKDIHGLNFTASSTCWHTDNNTHVTARGNNTYVYVPFDSYLHNNTNITLHNSSFKKLGQSMSSTVDANRKEGIKIHSAGNGSSVTRSYFGDSWQALYFVLGSGGSMSSKINVSHNRFENIKYTTIEFTGNGGERENASSFENNYVYCYANVSGVTAYAVYTSNTNGLSLLRNNITSCNYYGYDLVQNDKNFRIEYNNFYFMKNPIVLNVGMANGTIIGNNITWTWGGAAGIAIQNNSKNFTIWNNYIANTSGDAIRGYADLHTGANKWGTRNVTIYNNTMRDGHAYCVNFFNSSDLRIVDNNCTGFNGYGFYFLDNAENILVRRNRITDAGLYAIWVRQMYGGAANLTICENEFWDWNVSSDSNETRWFCGTRGNYFANDTTPDLLPAGHPDGIVDHPILIPGAGLVYDPYPLALPLGWTPTAPYQLVGTDLVNGSSVNYSSLPNTTIRAYFVSWNRTTAWLGIYDSGAQVDRILSTNYTWTTFDITNLTVGIHNVRFNDSYNITPIFSFEVTNTSPAAAHTHYITETMYGYYPGLAGFMLVDVIIFLIAIWLINGLRVNYELISTRRSPKANILYIRLEMAARFVGILVLMILGLVVVGYISHMSVEHDDRLAELSLVLFILNMIIIIACTIAGVVKLVTVPFREVAELLHEMVKKSNYRR